MTPWREGAPRRQRGIALVVVLWIVALLGLMAASQTAAIRTETRVVGNELDAARARAAAFDGVQLALQDLGRSRAERRWSADGTTYAAEFDDVTLEITLQDEAGKVDLNTAPAPLLDALLVAAGIVEEERAALVDAILDWRDRDNLARIHGMEARDYRRAGLAYGPANAPFQSLEELVLVPGFDTSRYHALVDGLTIYSASDGVNPAVAPPMVLSALATMASRGTAGTHDAAVVTPEIPGMFRSSSGGRVFTLRVDARTHEGAHERIEAVVHVIPTRPGLPLRYAFLRWREGMSGRATTG